MPLEGISWFVLSLFPQCSRFVEPVDKSVISALRRRRSKSPIPATRREQRRARSAPARSRRSVRPDRPRPRCVRPACPAIRRPRRHSLGCRPTPTGVAHQIGVGDQYRTVPRPSRHRRRPASGPTTQSGARASEPAGRVEQDPPPVPERLDLAGLAPAARAPGRQWSSNGASRPDRRRPPDVAGRKLARPGQHRIGEDQRPPAAPDPGVERGQLRRREPLRLGEEQQPPAPRVAGVEHVDRPEVEFLLSST